MTTQLSSRRVLTVPNAISFARILLIPVFVLLLLRRGGRIDVRFIGKVATFCLMFAVPAVAWGNFGLGGDAIVLALGWISYGVGILEYYIATALYVLDFRDALRATAS